MVKPRLEKVAAGLDHLDSGGGVLVGDGVGAATRGPLGHLAADVRHGADRMDMAVRRPPSIGDVGRGAAARDTLWSLRSVPHVDPLRPDVTHIVRVPDEMVSGPKSVWTTTTQGFAPNTAYVVAGRGTFVTDGSGTIKEIVVDKVKGEISQELNHPLPDMTYKVRGVNGDVTFVTDSAGNTVTARVEGLELGDGGRSKHIQGSVGQASNGEIYSQTPLSDGWRYEGGHLIGNSFDGVPERINIIGMLKELNQNISDGDSFYQFESAVRDMARTVPPPRIDLEINLVREPGAKTPARFFVDAKANGDTFYRREFENIIGMS